METRPGTEPEIKTEIKTEVNQLDGQQSKPKLPEVTQRNIKARKITYYLLGVLETLFTFRLVFKILGANPESFFVDAIYGVSSIFLAPFDGIFRSAVTDGIETQAVLEPKLLIAMASYAVLAWGITKLIELNGRQRD